MFRQYGSPLTVFRGTGELVCDRSFGDYGYCTPPVATGAACAGGMPCAAGDRCVDGRCVMVTTPGAPCAASAVCPTSHVCLEGRCEPRPVLGQSCDAIRTCFEGHCSGGVCSVLPTGAECDGIDEVPLGSCAGYCTNTTVGACAEIVAPGESCARDEACGPTGVCIAETLGDRRCAVSCVR